MKNFGEFFKFLSKVFINFSKFSKGLWWVHFCWMYSWTEILATPLQYRTWVEFMYEILSYVPTPNQNPGAATGKTNTLCTAYYTKITLLNNLKLTVLFITDSYRHGVRYRGSRVSLDPPVFRENQWIFKIYTRFLIILTLWTPQF